MSEPYTGAREPECARIRAVLERHHYDGMLTASIDEVCDELCAPCGPEQQLAGEILRELQRARTKFPGKNVTTLALVEEVGELAKATFEEGRERVRKEAVQVATMAMRVVLDGDSTLDEWRATKGLDALASRIAEPREPSQSGDLTLSNPAPEHDAGGV